MAKYSAATGLFVEVRVLFTVLEEPDLEKKDVIFASNSMPAARLFPKASERVDNVGAARRKRRK